jgi:hypothetical protein
MAATIDTGVLLGRGSACVRHTVDPYRRDRGTNVARFDGTSEKLGSLPSNPSLRFPFSAIQINFLDTLRNESAIIVRKQQRDRFTIGCSLRELKY